MKKIKEPRIPGQARMDGWSNFVTLMGTGSDKRMHSQLQWEQHSPEFYEQLYAGGGIPARIVDLIPEEALRHWIEWVGVDKATGEELHNRCEELDVRGALLRSWKWGRAFGGACCHIVTDTNDPASPLEIGEQIIGLRDLSRWDLRILTTDVEFDFGSPNWGQPRIYYLNVQMGAQYKGYPIHWTRMLRFDGQLVPRRTYIRNNYWHDSILNRIYNAIRNYETSNDAAAACLLDFNVDVFKMKNLANLISSGKEQIVKNRIETMNFVKSVINAMIIDPDQEDYENKSRSLEGVAELLDKQSNRLVAETDIPHTKLLGESPDGSNATGNSTSQNWYNFVATEQENYLRPKLKRLLGVMFPEYPDLDFKFKSLRVLDDNEKADLRLKVAQADDIYMTHHVTDPSEVAASRFGADEYSIETKLDWEARENGTLVPGEQEMLMQPGEGSGGFGENQEGGGQMNGDPFNTTGNEGEGNSSVESTSGTGENNRVAKNIAKEPAPSEPEPGQDMRGHEGEGKDISGVPKEKHPPATGPSAEGQNSRNANAEGTGIEGLFGNRKNPGTQYDLSNDEIKQGKTDPKTASFISQTMSEPMRDPRTDPHIKGPGIPNKRRSLMPTRGNGVTAQSGAEFEKDEKAKQPEREIAHSKGVEGGSYYAYDSAEPHTDPGVAATMKEFAKGTLKSGSGHKVTDPKQALAIGYNDQERKRAATIIVRDGDKFLMGKRKEDGRWSLPGGHIEKGESAHQGGVRELKEETNLDAKRLKFLGSRLVESEMNKPVEVTMYEHQHDGESKPSFKKDPDKEFDELRWLSAKDKLPEEIENNLAHPNNVALKHLGLIR
jgi:phage-related protein (TIGR01555 family)